MLELSAVQRLERRPTQSGLRVMGSQFVAIVRKSAAQAVRQHYLNALHVLPRVTHRIMGIRAISLCT